MESLQLKAISRSAVDRAFEKAERYRLLGEPRQAESICLDILDVAPGDQRTLVVLILALTDQFGTDGDSRSRQGAHEHCQRLADEYQRTYYTGIIAERQARAALRGAFRSFAYEGFRDALGHYARAEELRSPGDDDALLRWNSCVRTMRDEHLEPRPAEPESFLE